MISTPLGPFRGSGIRHCHLATSPFVSCPGKLISSVRCMGIYVLFYATKSFAVAVGVLGDMR